MDAARLECDEKGRVVIPKGLRDKFGDQYYAIEIRDTIHLIPIPKDPLKVLAEIGKKAKPEFHKLSIQQIKQQARAHAMENI